MSTIYLNIMALLSAYMEKSSDPNEIAVTPPLLATHAGRGSTVLTRPGQETYHACASDLPTHGDSNDAHQRQDGLFLEQLEIPRSSAFRMVERILETIKVALANGEEVLISRFGKFSVREKDKRRGRNPATGEDLSLRARRIVTFRCSPILKDRLNGGDSK
jgi:integration host factor subunit alpha